jgi:hypothetical protein
VSPTQVNSATIIIGNSGTGKSSLAKTFAEYLWETYSKVLHYYAVDGGGFPAAVQAAQRLGILRLFRVRSRGFAFETGLQASKGWWPAKINPSTGEVSPGVRMVPPITQTFELYCTNGHLVKTVRAQSMLVLTQCPQCKLQVTKETGIVKTSMVQTRGFEDVGGVFIDSLSGVLSWQMMDLAARRGRLELRGEEDAMGGRVIDNETALGGSNRAHYNFVQIRAEEMATNALSIPNLVAPPVFTALMLESTDKGGNLIKGPKLAGEAKTAEAPQWFGNCLETNVVQNEKGESVFRLYLKEYIDEHGARHLLKNRGAPGTMPPYLEDPPETSEVFSQFNLGKFFTLLEQGIATTESAMSERFPNTPGVPQGEVEYGEEPAPKQPAAVKPATIGPKGAAPKPAPRRAVPPTSAPHPAGLVQAAAAPVPAEPITMAEVDAIVEQLAAPAPAAPPTPPRPSPSIAGKAFAPPPAPRPPASAPRPPMPVKK